MKNVLNWIKKNLISVVSVVVALAALPAMLIVGLSMSSKTNKAVEQEVGKHLTDLARVKVEYAIEPLTPGAERFSASMPPNAATNQRMKELLERNASQIADVQRVVTEFNQAGRAPLMDGLFPDPGDPIQAPEKLYAMARTWIAAYEPLLRSVNAGGPPEPEAVLRRLDDLRLREEETRRGGRADAVLGPQDNQEIRERLSEERMQIYLSRAAALRFYADAAIFTGVAPWTDSVAPTISRAWEWQWLFWVHEDLVRAMAAANEGFNVLTGPVKRIERIDVDPMSYSASAAEQGSADPTAEAPTNFGATLTGRVAAPAAANSLYDIRYATVVVLVDASRVFDVVNALAATNLMTVIDLDLASVDDLSAHMRNGFVYTRGGERVMRATIRVETLWLRSWTTPLMPPVVQSALGVPGSVRGEASPDDSGRRPRPANTPNRAPAQLR